MKIVQFTFFISDDLRIKSMEITQNETSLKNDSELVKGICHSVIRGLEDDKEGIAVQEVLFELGIKRQ